MVKSGSAMVLSFSGYAAARGMLRSPEWEPHRKRT